jgi:peptidoglycan hydrolase CwlO-like protein
MEIATIISIIAVCLTAIAFLVTQGRRGGQMEADIKSIKATTDKIDDKLDNLAERVTAVEQSVKSAHHRIDEIKTKKN